MSLKLRSHELYLILEKYSMLGKVERISQRDRFVIMIERVNGGR